MHNEEFDLLLAKGQDFWFDVMAEDEDPEDLEMIESGEEAGYKGMTQRWEVYRHLPSGRLVKLSCLCHHYEGLQEDYFDFCEVREFDVVVEKKEYRPV